MKNMREQLVESIFLEIGLPKSTILKMFDVVFNSIVDLSKDGKRVRIKDFGTFFFKNKKNINENDLGKLSFIPSKKLKQFINE